METAKTKLIVVNEHTLGYFLPGETENYGVLHASILKGATFEISPGIKSIKSLDNVRLASEKDFEAFRVSFEGFGNRNEYEFS